GAGHFLGSEHSSHRWLARIEHRYKQCSRIDQPFAYRRQMGQQHRRGNTASADTQQVNIRTAGDIRNDAGDFLDSSDIFGQAVTSKFGAGIAPAYSEKLNPVRDRILSQTPLRGQVHDVVFVNLRWHQQQWALVDLPSRRRVLNQFAKL